MPVRGGGGGGEKSFNNDSYGFSNCIDNRKTLTELHLASLPKLEASCISHVNLITFYFTLESGFQLSFKSYLAIAFILHCYAL